MHCGVPVHSGTAPFSAGPYACNMQLESIEAAIVTVSGSDLSACVHKVLRFWPASCPSAARLMWR